MKIFFRNITSLLLAGLVLVSTLSFTVEKHYCGRFLVDVAVFSKAKDCGMKMSNHTTNQNIEIKKSSCCKDELVLLQGQDELTTSFNQINISQQDFIIFPSYNYQYVVFEQKERHILSEEYAPPERVKDILILHETFLI